MAEPRKSLCPGDMVIITNSALEEFFGSSGPFVVYLVKPTMMCPWRRGSKRVDKHGNVIAVFNSLPEWGFAEKINIRCPKTGKISGPFSSQYFRRYSNEVDWLAEQE